MKSIFISSWIDTGTKPKVETKINDKLKKGIIVEYLPENIRQRRYEKNIRKRHVYDAMLGKRKSFPLSLPVFKIIVTPHS